MVDLIQFQQEAYFFQIIPLKLSIIKKESQVQPLESSYSLSVFKGLHRFDKVKLPSLTSQAVLRDIPSIDISSCKLAFYVPNYNKTRQQEFTLILIQNYKNQDWKVGECTIDAGAIADDFKVHHQYFYQFTTQLSEKYQLTFFILVDKTKAILNEKVNQLAQKQFNKIFVKTSKRDQPINKQIQNDPIVLERSEKNMVSSKTSIGKRVPFLEVTYKAVTKKDAPGHQRYPESVRVSSEFMQSEFSSTKSSTSDKSQASLTLWIFLGISLILIYFAMIPNRKI